MASNVGGDFAGGEFAGEEFAGGVRAVLLVMLESGGGSRYSRGIVIDCSACIVAEGGVFSPSMAFCRCREDGRRAGVSLNTSRANGVGVPN